MELWYVTNGYSYPIEETRNSYFVGPRGWECGYESPFDWAAVMVTGRELADAIASVVNQAIERGHRPGDYYPRARMNAAWKIYRPLPVDCPSSYWLSYATQKDPTDDDDPYWDFDRTHPVRIKAGRDLALFVLFAINDSITRMLNRVEDMSLMFKGQGIDSEPAA